MIWVKFGRESKEFREPFPAWVLVFWFSVISSFCAWFHYHFFLVPQRMSIKSGGKKGR